MSSFRSACGFAIGLSAIATFIHASPLIGADSNDMIEDQVTHHYAKNGETSIHYTSMGQGPLIVMIHGFPDFWYSWRHQMAALAPHYQTVAIDQRGYNLSDKPTGVDQYKIQHLVEDVHAVIQDCKRDQAIVVGHDWGGFVAWNVAMTYPKVTDKLIILNLPHPTALARELANNPKQQENSEYARRFQKENAHQQLNAEGLAGWVTDVEARKKYVTAFKRSDFEAMLNYYKANYPRMPYKESSVEAPKIQCPVLMFHGLDDWALLPGGLNGTWDYLQKDLTLVTLPGSGHFVQQDKAERVSKNILSWLQLQKMLE
jgi:epoxide hydrolase 4